MSNNSFNFNILHQTGLSRNIHKAGCAIWDMRYGMKKEKKKGAGWKIWDMGLQISDCGFRIVDIIKSALGASYKDTVVG